MLNERSHLKQGHSRCSHESLLPRRQRNLTDGANASKLLLRGRQGKGYVPQASEVYTLYFACGEGNSVLHSPVRQKVFSDLQPVFERINSPGNVEDGTSSTYREVEADGPIAFTILLTTMTNSVKLKIYHCGTPFWRR
jgi:hypothetical protein